jgi:hypothetical protein
VVHMFMSCDLNIQLVFLSDVFDKLNTLNNLLHGGDNILRLGDKLKLFIRKV